MDKLKLDGLMAGSADLMQPSSEDLSAVAAFWQGRSFVVADQDLRAVLVASRPNFVAC